MPMDPRQLLEAWTLAQDMPSHARVGALAAVLANHASSADQSPTGRDRALARLLQLAGQEALADCPACGATIALRLPEALLEEPALPVATLAGVPLPIRVPTNADIQAVSGTDDPAHRLAERLAGRPLDAEGARVVAEALVAADPLIDPAIGCRCPACNADVTLDLDTGRYALTLIERQVRGLFAEINVLAQGYGWSEADILALPPSRRAHYCGMLSA